MMDHHDKPLSLIHTNKAAVVAPLFCFRHNMCLTTSVDNVKSEYISCRYLAE